MIKLPYAIAILEILFLLTSGCASFEQWKYLPTNRAEERPLYVVSHGWHTGIVIRQENLGEEFTFLTQHLGDYPFYEFGWGDEDFYQAKEITTGITLRAIFWPTKSVLHVVGVPEAPQRYFPHSQTIPVRISEKAHRKINAAILRTFKLDNQNFAKPTKEGLYGRSLFFEGLGYYYITNTCNTWTAKMLDEAGVPISSFLTLTAGSVMEQTREATNRYHCCIEN